MRKNALLEEQIFSIFEVDAASRTRSGFFSITTSAGIQNGYSTGYELLHGTNADVGGFNISGFAFADGGEVYYSTTMTWNDRIDPNFAYRRDSLYSFAEHMMHDPKDYTVQIPWDDNFTIRK